MQSGVTLDIAEAVLAATDKVRGAVVGVAQQFRVLFVPAIAMSSTNSAPTHRSALTQRVGATAAARPRAPGNRRRAKAATSVTKQRYVET